MHVEYDCGIEVEFDADVKVIFSPFFFLFN